MAMDPSLILDTIEKNVARQNRFSFILTLPQVQNVQADITTLEYYCKSANLPSQTITPIEAKYLGLLRYTLTTQEVDTAQVTFYDTKQLVLRTMFKNWLDEITVHNKGEVLKYYPSQYQTTATLTIEEKSHTFEGICPISVSDWAVDMDTDNSLGTFTVTFKVKNVS